MLNSALICNSFHLNVIPCLFAAINQCISLVLVKMPEVVVEPGS